MQSVVALVTPFKYGEVDYEALERLIELHTNARTHGLLLCGSTGEGYLLSPKERYEITQFVRAKVSIPIIVGCGGFTADQVLAQIFPKDEFVLVAPPPYIKPSQAAIYNFYKEIHDRCNCYIVVYNNPARCGVNIEMPTLERLLDLQRIAGIKNSDTDLTYLWKYAEWARKNLIFCGEDVLIPAYLAHGIRGAISVVGNIVPDLMTQLLETNSIDEAGELCDKIMPIVESMKCGPNPTPVKFLLNQMGLIQNELRPPLCPLDKPIRLDFLKNAS